MTQQKWTALAEEKLKITKMRGEKLELELANLKKMEESRKREEDQEIERNSLKLDSLKRILKMNEDFEIEANSLKLAALKESLKRKADFEKEQYEEKKKIKES